MKFQLPTQFKDKFAKERFSFGVDIGTNSVKAVKLRFFKDTVEFCGLEIEPVQLDVAEILRKIKKTHSVDSIAISLSGASSLVRYISFPKMNASELKQALKFEAQKHIPFALNDVNLDGFILKDDPANNKMQVLLAVAKKDAVTQRVKIAQDAGLHVSSVDLDSVALMNAFCAAIPAKELEKTIALLHVGASVSSLNILSGGTPYLSRDIHIAGNNFTQKIADLLGVDFNKAETLKKNPPADSLAKITLVEETVLTGLASEVRTSFDFFESSNAAAVSKIYVSGGSSKTAGFSTMLSNALGIEVSSWDAFNNISFGTKFNRQDIATFSADLAVALGLALRK